MITLEDVKKNDELTQLILSSQKQLNVRLNPAKNKLDIKYKYPPRYSLGGQNTLLSYFIIFCFTLQFLPSLQ